MISVVRVDEDGNRGSSRHQFAEQLETFWFPTKLETVADKIITTLKWFAPSQLIRVRLFP